MTIPARRLSASDAYRQAVEVSLFECANSLPVDARVWGTALNGGATVSHVGAESAVKCLCSTASGDLAQLRSHARLRAAAGRARATRIVGHASGLIEGQRKSWGLFDDANGYFFELDGETLSCVRRTNVSGSVVETVHANAQWTEDKSSIDATKTHAYEIRECWPNSDISWFVDGVLVHVMSTDGSITGPSSRSARLPASVEVENDSSGSAQGSFSLIAAAVYAEEAPRHTRSSAVGVSDGTVDGTGQALFSIRPKSTFSSISNDGELQPGRLTALLSGDARLQLYVGSAVADGSWVSHGTSSLAESNVTTVALPTGTLVAEYVCAGAGYYDLSDLLEPLRVFADGTQDDLTVVANSLTGGSITARVALTWRETR